MTSSHALLEHRKLDYLDLASQCLSRKIITLDQNKYSCYSRTKTFIHCLHWKTPRLNTINTDLVISLESSLEAQQQHIFKSVHHQITTSLI